MQELELLGIPGSPYTRKMLALLRFRRIPYHVIWGTHFDPPKGYPNPKVKLLPTFYFNTVDGREAVVDSTPIIHRLESEYRDRSVIPGHPLLAFLDFLIEDYADEWLTKAMFHYRWHHAEDASHAAPLLIYWQHPQITREHAQKMGQVLAQRQTSRLPVVGSSLLTAQVIESSYERLIGVMDRIIERHGFILGSRPASSDFAIYGQLTQLGLIDPTPARLLEQKSPRLRAWLDRAEDLSGHVDASWIEISSIAEHLGELLQEIGRVYAPFLVANAKAMTQGQASFSLNIDDQPWVQSVFPYQLKCLEALRQARLGLTAQVREALDALLVGTGCEQLFQTR